MQIEFIGHATFELVDGDARVLIDPFLAPNNPAAKVSADEVEPTHILLTHGHETTSPTRSRSPSAPAPSASRSPSSPAGSASRASRRRTNPNLGGTVELRLGQRQARPRLAHEHDPRRDRDRHRRRG